jgi:DNA-binding LacI/PurR family transcriptional regulator
MDLTRVKEEQKQAAPTSPTTMEELSKILGISRVTISKVINGRAGVAPETQQRILAAIEATAFRPNVPARDLRLKHTQRLGVVITGVKGWTFYNWYYGEYLRGILEEAEDTGFNVTLYTHKASPQLAEDTSQLVRAREVDAVLMVGSNATTAQIQPLLDQSIPFIVLGALPEGIHTNSVYYDNSDGAKMAVEHLIRLGHRRIGLVGQLTKSNQRFMSERIQGATAALRAARLKPLGENGPLISIDELAHNVRTTGPCAALTLTYTYDYVQKLLELGLRIPNDVALVGFNYPITVCLSPRFTIVEQPLVEIGRRAVQKVVAMLREQTSITPTEHLPMRLVQRGEQSNPIVYT